MDYEEEVKKLKRRMEKMETAFAEQIRIKDKRIQELEKNNDLLMRTALRQSEENEKLKEIIAKQFVDKDN